jgi:hypothetical protein
MKLENQDQLIDPTNHSKNEPADSSGASSDATGAERRDSEAPVGGGHPREMTRQLLVVSGVALCLGFASCVGPYDTLGGGSASLTNYRPGYQVSSLPGGYRSEIISGSTYYYHDGYYYRPGSSGYTVVDAPRNSRYYGDYSRRQLTYGPNRDYRQPFERHDQRYERGGVINRLPDGYQVVNHRGSTYYQNGDRYYRRQGNSYIIVSRPY